LGVAYRVPRGERLRLGEPFPVELDLPVLARRTRPQA
jgi:hypothetical protein